MSATLIPDATSQYYDTLDLSFNQEDSRKREETRWLWTPADFIEEARKRDFGEALKSGGDEINSPCLWRYSPKKYLKRGRFQPLEVGPEYHTGDDIEKADQRAALRIVPNAKGRPSLYGIGVFPGEQIRKILQPDAAANFLPRGRVEIGFLAGRNFKRSTESGDDLEISNLTRFYFPMGLEALPVTLRELQQLVRVAGDKLTSSSLTDEEKELLSPFKISDVETCSSEMERACNQFRAWGTHVIGRANQLVAKSTAKFVYGYQDIERVIMRQLEIKPVTTAQADDDQTARIIATGIQQAAQAMTPVQPSQPAPRFNLDDFKALVDEHPEEVKALLRAKPGPKPKEE